MNRARFLALRSSFTFLILLGGCTWRPWGNDEGRTNDAGVTEKEACTQKVSACRNTCYEADRGRTCLSCCADNGESCDRGDDYSFYGCPDKE
jgi:hypothetical protein